MLTFWGDCDVRNCFGSITWVSHRKWKKEQTIDNDDIIDSRTIIKIYIQLYITSAIACRSVFFGLPLLLMTYIYNLVAKIVTSYVHSLQLHFQFVNRILLLQFITNMKNPRIPNFKVTSRRTCNQELNVHFKCYL